MTKLWTEEGKKAAIADLQSEETGADVDISALQSDVTTLQTQAVTNAVAGHVPALGSSKGNYPLHVNSAGTGIEPVIAIPASRVERIGEYVQSTAATAALGLGAPGLTLVNFACQIIHAYIIYNDTLGTGESMTLELINRARASNSGNDLSMGTFTISLATTPLKRVTYDQISNLTTTLLEVGDTLLLSRVYTAGSPTGPLARNVLRLVMKPLT